MTVIASMGDIKAIEARGMPSDLPTNTYDMICRGAAINPNGRALSLFVSALEHERVQTWTYQELLARVHQTANFFHELGIAKGDVIALILPNLPATHLALWGGQAAGIVFPINPMLDASAITQLLQESAAKVVVTLGPLPGSDLCQKTLSALSRCPDAKHLVLVTLTPSSAASAVPSLPAGKIVRNFSDGIAKQLPDRLISGRKIQADDLSSFFCTGGTTGTPKIAMRRHANEVANAWSAGQFLGDAINPTKTLFCGLPLYHVNGVLVTGLLPFSRGAHVLMGTPQGFRGEHVIARFWDIVAHHRVNLFSGVPTVYASLIQVPVGNRDISCLEYGLCGAAPMPSQVMRTFEAQTGVTILEGYGLTEGTCVSSVNPPLGERRLGSVGIRIPFQDMKAAHVDDDGRYVRDCGVDEVGTLLISGPNLFAGYRVATQDSGLWLDAGEGRRWLNTGDLGRQDAEGYFYLTGRKKELIIRGGHNIDPQLIEDALHRHPGVQLAAAVGRPDPRAGEIPVAYVQLKAGENATEAELLAFAAGHIGERAAVPKSIRIVDQVPLTGVGKIFKPELKIRETRDALTAALEAANIQVAGLNVVNDPATGLTALIRLQRSADFASVHEVLGQFSITTRFQNP